MKRLLPLLMVVVALAAAEEPVQINLPAKVGLDKLTGLIGDLVGVTVQYNPQRLKGETHLALRGSYGATELWSIYNQVLGANGFASVITGEPPIYQVVQQGEAAKIALLQTSAEVQAMRLVPSYVKVVHELGHLAPDTAAQLLGPLLSGQGGQVKALGKDEHRVLISGLTTQVRPVLTILSTFDRPELTPTYEQVTPVYATPQKLMASVQAAWAAAGRVHGKTTPAEFQLTPDGSRILIIAARDRVKELVALTKQLDQSEPVTSQTYRSAVFPMDAVADLINEIIGQGTGGDRLKITRDRLTQSLIIQATTGQHARINELLDDLAKAPAEARRQMRSFGIKHRQAAVMATLVQNLLGSGLPGAADEAQDQTAATTQPAGQTQPAATPPSQTGQQTTSDSAGVNITVDDATNTLIVVGTPRMIDRVAELIERLDVRTPQVAIEVIFVSITDNESESLGIDLAGRFEQGETSVNLSSLFTDRTDTDTTAGAAEPDAATQLFGNLLGASGLVVTPGDFASLIQAVETVSDGKKVIRGRMLVDNNAEASLDGVNQQPLTSVNFGDQVQQQTFAGTADAGTQIAVTPLIGAGDQLTITYTVSQSGFTGRASEENLGVPPPKRSDSLSSIATIPDGYTIVLGGISQFEEGMQESRVPILGSIPLLGWLFRKRAVSMNESKFYVFIRASVLRHQSFEDLKYLSQRALDDAAISDEAWPTLEPRFIDE